MGVDPLANLLLDREEVDRTRLANVLQEIVGIDKGSGAVVLKPGFSRLDSTQKIIAYLLGRKVAVLLERANVEAASPTTVAKETGMPRGTVNPKLVELHKRRLLSKTERSEYYVTPALLAEAIRELEREDDQ